MFQKEEQWKYWTKDIQCGAARKEEKTDIMKEVHEGRGWCEEWGETEADDL